MPITPSKQFGLDVELTEEEYTKCQLLDIAIRGSVIPESASGVFIVMDLTNDEDFSERNKIFNIYLDVHNKEHSTKKPHLFPSPAAAIEAYIKAKTSC